MFENHNITDTKGSKEDYLLLRAKEAMSTDIYAAKSWLITAKSLFPHSVKVQFEAYRIEKLSKNVKEAAKCFSEIFQNFPENAEIWKEIESITACLRSEKSDPECELLCQMFQHIPQELQHRLLIMTADHSEDTMEHCKLLLLLLRRFPQTIATHGPRLVETLLTAEKHSHPWEAVNDFRRLLACDALPLLGEAPVELNARLSLRLLCKAVEFYLVYIQQTTIPDYDIQLDYGGNQIQQPWDKLFKVMEVMGAKLSWELGELFSTPWNQEAYCDRLQQFSTNHTSNLNDEAMVKQLTICTIVVLIRILSGHLSKINHDNTEYCLVEAFAEPYSTTETKIKKRKREDNSGIVLTSDDDYDGQGLISAVMLWDILNRTELMKREIAKLSQQMHLETWINPFLNDVAIYKGQLHDVLTRFSQVTIKSIAIHLRLASTYFFLKDYAAMLENIVKIAESRFQVRGKVSTKLSVPAIRHVHYLPIEELPVLQFCCKLLLAGMKTKIHFISDPGDWTIGNSLVLMQIDWPQEANLFISIIEAIKANKTFQYPLFLTYIINIDILEELTYLWTEHGGGISLDIAIGSEVLQKRRITTRGTDKGVREEVRQAMRHQAARDSVDPIEKLIQKFIVDEKAALLHSLLRK
ncbi:integrator complex subunit 10 [Chelonus insularis]|uniref:integrator complex subunit 10 n=1 Tax=Chelonus insularis TaxID=460826 RepID=UPI00158C3B98|nr:integrator complex subunit 10 [Chelonus insularis]